MKVKYLTDKTFNTKQDTESSVVVVNQSPYWIMASLNNSSTLEMKFKKNKKNPSEDDNITEMDLYKIYFSLLIKAIQPPVVNESKGVSYGERKSALLIAAIIKKAPQNILQYRDETGMTVFDYAVKSGRADVIEAYSKKQIPKYNQIMQQIKKTEKQIEKAEEQIKSYMGDNYKYHPLAKEKVNLEGKKKQFELNKRDWKLKNKNLIHQDVINQTNTEYKKKVSEAHKKNKGQYNKNKGNNLRSEVPHVEYSINKIFINDTTTKANPTLLDLKAKMKDKSLANNELEQLIKNASLWELNRNILPADALAELKDNIEKARDKLLKDQNVNEHRGFKGAIKNLISKLCPWMNLKSNPRFFKTETHQMLERLPNKIQLQQN